MKYKSGQLNSKEEALIPSFNILQIGTAGERDHVFDFCEKYAEELAKVVLVEPLTAAMGETKKCYLQIPNVEFIQAAVVDFDSDEVEVFLPKESELDKSAHASLSKEHVVKHLHPNTRSVIVPAIRINELLEKFDGPIHRVYIDTEGFDARIIMDIDFERFTIPYLQFEIAHTDGPHQIGANFQMLVSKLQELGYVLHRSGEYDAVGILQNPNNT